MIQDYVLFSLIQVQMNYLKLSLLIAENKMNEDEDEYWLQNVNLKFKNGLSFFFQH